MSRRLAVVLCSRDRAPQVSECLQRLDIPSLAACNAQVVLVDNGSHDATPTVFERFAAATSTVPVRVVREPRAGLSRARNAGVRASDAPVIVFLDDDVYFADGYFARVLAEFDAGAPGLGVLGGRILRHDPGDSLYGCQLSEHRRDYAPGDWIRPGAIQGANFAASRACFDALEGFDEALGAGAKYRCEDVDFIARALQAGFAARYEPELVAYHDHGRKDGADIEDLRRANSHAAGAFFAKMTLRGHRVYWPWLAAYVASAPLRPNMKLGPFVRGWRDYRAEFGGDGDD